MVSDLWMRSLDQTSTQSMNTRTPPSYGAGFSGLAYSDFLQKYQSVHS